jgi:LysR family carnitine catabolism transcriptional activator
MHITLKQVEAFLAVARTLSFSEGAVQAHLSQPALSASIGRLEEIVGARLFDRDTRSVSLSAIGAEFMPVALGIVGGIEHGMARLQDILAGKQGRLNIAVAPSVAAGVLPDILARYSADYPQIELRIHDVMSNACVDMVRSGAVDVALMPLRSDVEDLAQRLLFRDPLVVLCATGHPLAGRHDLEWQDIIASKLIVRSTDSSVRQMLDAQYLQHGVVLKPAFEVHHAGTVLGLIVAGLGIGVLPSSVMHTVNMQGLVRCDFSPRAKHHWSICVCTPKNRSNPSAVGPFVQLCFDRLGQ